MGVSSRNRSWLAHRAVLSREQARGRSLRVAVLTMIVASSFVLAPSLAAASRNYGKVTVSGATRGTYVVAYCEIYPSRFGWIVELYGSNTAPLLSIDQTSPGQHASRSVNLATTKFWHVLFVKPDRQNPTFESNASWEAGFNYYLWEHRLGNPHRGSGTLSISSDAESGSVSSTNMVPTISNVAKRKAHLKANWHCVGAPAPPPPTSY
jgi:hypothetical protein